MKLQALSGRPKRRDDRGSMLPGAA